MQPPVVSARSADAAAGPELVPNEAAEPRRLAGLINTAIRDAELHAVAAVRAAVQAGNLLRQAKENVPHGQWEAWISEHCVCAVRTAQAYMRLAAKFSELPSDEAQRVADMPLRQAMQAITAPATAPAAFRPQHYMAHRGNEARERFGRAYRALKAAHDAVGLKPIKRERLRALQEKLIAALAEVQEMVERAS